MFITHCSPLAPGMRLVIELVGGESLLSTAGEKPIQMTCGSTNYTTEGLTSQANLVHTFASTELAELYLERFRLLKKNPTRTATAKETGWSHTVSIGDAGIRVFFSPEPGRPHISARIVKRMNTMYDNSSSSYSCINCGTRHNETACPKCGSKMKRADFHRF